MLFSKALWEALSNVIACLIDTRQDVCDLWFKVLIVDSIVEINITPEIFGKSTVNALLEGLVLKVDTENRKCEQLLYINECSTPAKRRYISV